MNRDEGSYQLGHTYDCFLHTMAVHHIKIQNWVPAFFWWRPLKEVETSRCLLLWLCHKKLNSNIKFQPNESIRWKWRSVAQYVSKNIHTAQRIMRHSVTMSWWKNSSLNSGLCLSNPWVKCPRDWDHSALASMPINRHGLPSTTLHLLETTVTHLSSCSRTWALLLSQCLSQQTEQFVADECPGCWYILHRPPC